MKTVSSKPRRALLFLIVVIALLLVAPTSYAKVRTEPADLPYYARIELAYVPHTDEWAAIVFYRLPDCVPDDFNLLGFYDFSAFSCECTTEGFYIWAGEPWVSAPIQAKLQGLGAVPVWFVAWSELQAAIGDGELYMPELEAIPSLLIGSASFYNETLHPAAVVPMINFMAHGTLDDGRSFEVHGTWPGWTEQTNHTHIEFD